MQPEIINARWTVDGISVPYADYFSVLVFIAYLNLIKMHAAIPTISSFKFRPAEVKSKYNHKFKNPTPWKKQ